MNLQDKPISVLQYLLYFILFNIPCVVIIVLIIFAIGGSVNLNVRNFARGMLLLWLICIFIGFFIGIIMVLTGATIFKSLR